MKYIKMIFVTCKDISYKYCIVAMAVSQLLVLFLFHSSLSVPNTADSTYIIFFVYWLELTCLHQDSIISMSYIIASIIVMLLPCLSCGWIDMSCAPAQHFRRTIILYFCSRELFFVRVSKYFVSSKRLRSVLIGSSFCTLC